jgi:hypothetical protein
VEHPLNGAVEQDRVVKIGNLPVEPEVNAGDGGGFKVSELLAERSTLGSFGKNAVEGIEGQGEDEIVEGFLRIRFLIVSLRPQPDSHL